MNCPKCNEVLVMSERQGIEIDYCPVCRGIWLDRGDLDKIIERSEKAQSPADYNPNNKMQDQRHHDYKHEHYKHKKNWLSELFDWLLLVLPSANILFVEGFSFL